MKLAVLYAVPLAIAIPAAGTAEPSAKAIVAKVVQTVGGLDALRAHRDVRYTYTYSMPDGKKDVSEERYIFDGELSWARYSKRGAHALPTLKGTLVQGYDGKSTWATLDGKPTKDAKALKLSDFARKTNFYWFAMMFKLLDPGLKYTLKKAARVGGKDYQVVGVGFDKGVGDVQDTYVLYINRDTNLVDQFLFTVVDFGKKDPLLMRVEYEKIAGLMLPTRRSYTPSDWKATVKPAARWVRELSHDIKFNNGFKAADFSPPNAAGPAR